MSDNLYCTPCLIPNHILSHIAIYLPSILLFFVSVIAVGIQGNQHVYVENEYEYEYEYEYCNVLYLQHSVTPHFGP